MPFTLGLRGAVRADLVAEPPARLEVRPRNATVGEPPRVIDLRIRNPGASALVLQRPRLILLAAQIRIPLTITKFVVDGRTVPRTESVSLAPGATLRVRLEIAPLPESARAASRYDFALRFEGTGESTFSLYRGPR